MHKERKKRATGANLALLGLGLAGTYLAWRAAQQGRIRAQNQRLRRGRTIVILGAGFGGRQAALELARQLPAPEDGEIILVDQDGFLLFTPMLAEAAGGELDTVHIVSPVTRLPARITFIQGRVDEIDLRQRRVTLTVGQADANVPQSQRILTADHLVIALGSATNFHHIPGLEEHSLTMKSPADAAVLRERALALLRRANEEPNALLRRELLTFVVGGAGLTGVETMAAMNGLLRESASKFPGLDPDEIQTILVEPGSRILPELSEELAHYAQQELEHYQVKVRLNTKVTGAGPDYVELDGKERIPTRTLIWAGGITPSPLVQALDCPHSRHGAIVVDEHLAVPGFPGVWALGDSAQVPKPGGTGSYGPTAQNAVREGALVGHNIAAVLRGQAPQPFQFRPLGELALVGRHAGVARILGFQFKGIIAWAMWRMIYWSKMPGLAPKMRILSDWLLDLAFGRNLVPMSPLPTEHPLSPQPEPALNASP